MTLRERHDHPRDPAHRPAGPASGPPDQPDLLAAAERLLARGGDAIERALSQDSAAFLAANRQEGGQ
jgi:hypothetical protein